MHKSVQMLWWCAGCALGIALSTADVLQDDATLYLLIGGCFLYALFQWVPTRVVALIAIGGAMGMARVALIEQYDANIYDTFTTFQATVVRESTFKEDTQRVTVEASSIEGLVLLQAPLQPAYRVGDQLTVSCMLRKPEPFEEFRYDKYLQRYGIGATCYYPDVERVGTADTFASKLFASKQWLVQRLQHTLAAPENTIILGSVFGMNSTLPPHLEDAFRRTGTIHLLVISGSNVVIITAVLMGMMKYLPLSRRNAIYIVVAFLLVYATYTGWQPPAVRATFFGGVALLASLLGRASQAIRLLVIVATGMLFMNPLLLLYDAGFQLSFLATAGIILFSKQFEERLQKIPEFLGLRTATAVTIAATLTTAPLIAYSFHTFSIISLPANLVVGPLMETIMLAGCVASLLGAILPPLVATWLFLPLYYAIHLTLQIVQWFNTIPYAAINLPEFSAAGLLIMYVCISYYAYKIRL